ncbi:MAG: UDP-N-acetylmuramoyl-tripeptide--D-alanyl-D-alanine ligase [Bacteroidales bacterium]|nr:UDP-N-acetylmuramoyl-tripeptide--D-alanyl-D-alanine ligase [Bacteroidales bacterium]MCF8404250.1 UDP-N-acetylmuramoyl-tripeptide--D-alanyl-D-alanine ligase [Bacteroidales bacterium]
MHIIERLYQHFIEFPFVSTDSRQVKPNSIFFALKGDNFNGNRFTSTALERGAEIAVVDEPDAVINSKCILVGDVLQTLQNLAAYHRDQLKTTLIGITGSNGKTTTKELTAAILGQEFKTIATQGNLNNHIGVPLTLLSIPFDADFGIVEMGANHIGEIAKLSSISKPDFGIITNIGHAHLEGFGSFEGVVKAKTELYNYLFENKRHVFLHIDNKLLTEKAIGIPQITYGIAEEADYTGYIMETFPYVNLKFANKGLTFELTSNLSGKFNFENILAAASIGSYFNVPYKKIQSAIRNYIPENNRSQYKKTDRNTLIMDAYNANPSSMAASIRSFAESGYTDKVVILGEMLELGDYTKEEHQKIIELVNEFSFVNAYFIGTSYKSAFSNSYNYFTSTEEFIKELEINPILKKTILIKGSRGNKLEQIIPFL